ncbi:helix-turn-helix domain-containing protein [Bacillus clarus]|uniref:helix-turn-helix domain-containing protein n=1 Tax=Bacillus clarus TaxID=2338372 RepID=UPI00216AE589|nr:helix-turn-helix transcriptional regulator [Bacillus clarus]
MRPNSMKTLGETLKKLRKIRSLRQADLAHELNLSRSQINNYENGFSEPDLMTMFRLASYFNVTLDVLTGRTDVTDDEMLHNQWCSKTYGALSESQRENFCKQLDHYVRFLGENQEIL